MQKESIYFSYLLFSLSYNETCNIKSSPIIPQLCDGTTTPSVLCMEPGTEIEGS